MGCLDPTGNRSTRFKLLKTIFLGFFGLSGTQLFALFFHFLRLMCYVILPTSTFPPKLLPRQTSLFGMEIFQNDLSFDDNSSTVHTIQVIGAGLLSALFGAGGIWAICREKIKTMKIFSLVMLLVTFITGMGSFSSPNLVNIKNIILPLLGGGVSSLVSLVWSLINQQQQETERSPTYQNYYNRYS